ncbi:MAG: Hsp20/alpha crystallin family protein [Candidatus Micrarchaeaceae archaeon]
MSDEDYLNNLGKIISSIIESLVKNGGIAEFDVKLDDKGAPIITKKEEAKQNTEEYQKSLFEVLEDDKFIHIVMQLQNVNKEDIVIKAKPECVNVRYKQEQKEVRKEIKMPKLINPAHNNITYKNGVLNLTFKKVSSRKEVTLFVE